MVDKTSTSTRFFSLLQLTLHRFELFIVRTQHPGGMVRKCLHVFVEGSLQELVGRDWIELGLDIGSHFSTYVLDFVLLNCHKRFLFTSSFFIFLNFPVLFLIFRCLEGRVKQLVGFLVGS